MKVYVLYEENGCYSDYSMSITGVFSTEEKALAQITDPTALQYECWDGTIENRNQFSSGPKTENSWGEQTTYTIAEWKLDELPSPSVWPESVHEPLPAPKFAIGDRVRSVSSKRQGVVVANRDWQVGVAGTVLPQYTTSVPTYGREVIVLPDDDGFIGRGVHSDGKLRATEEQLERVPDD